MRRSISAQSFASVPPSPAVIVRMASLASYSPENISEVRSASYSVSRFENSESRPANTSVSPSASASCASSSASSARWISDFQVASSSRSPSASRNTLPAARWSDQKSGSADSASTSSRRACLAARSKAPRGRVNALDQVAQLGQFHQPTLSSLARSSWSMTGRSSMMRSAVLLRATTGLTHGQYPLCGQTPQFPSQSNVMA